MRGERALKVYSEQVSTQTNLSKRVNTYSRLVQKGACEEGGSIRKGQAEGGG